MENEGANQGNVTPVFGGESPDYSGMGEKQAQIAYQQLMTDRIGGKNNWSGDRFSETVEKLYRKGFSRQLEEKEAKQAQENRAWLEEENRRIEKQEGDRELGEARREVERYFQGREQAERAVEQANAVLRDVKREEDPKADYNFFEETGLGLNPRIIEIIGNLHGYEELYPLVRKIGIAGLLRIGEIALRRREK